MNKLIITALLSVATFTLCLAQENTGLYLFKKAEYSEIVVKVFEAELKLSNTELNKLRAIITSQAKNQSEVLSKPENNKPETLKVIEARSTATIENDLKQIFSTDRYNIYLQKKAAITARVKAMEK